VFGRAHAAYFAFAVPAAQVVTEISAYSAHGEIAYAVPFTARGSVEPVRWLKPGQPALPSPARYRIGSGTVNGTPWAEYLYLGPWGTCFGEPGGSLCLPVRVDRLAQGKLATVLGGSAPGSTYFVPVAAAPSVSYLLVHTAYRGSFRVRMVPVRGERFAAFAIAPGSGRVTWAAFSAAGVQLASGGVP
jgi:hypothetical protein